MNDDFERQFKIAKRMVWTAFFVNFIIVLVTISAIAFAAIHFIKKAW